ncbi:hypothetical protein AJ88_31175 [Mesorhizobium amorphae CCBAU 01583]|nr:hypothetical protein AJ88_31175 [Mesorhizobium amorphae CCBAU 01583]
MRRRRLSTSSVVASVIGPTPKNGFDGSLGAPDPVSWNAFSRCSCICAMFMMICLSVFQGGGRIVDRTRKKKDANCAEAHAECVMVVL